MGILNYIRQKPDNQKKVISLVSAVVLTLVITAVWFSFTKNEDVATGDEPSKLSAISPIQVIKDEFSKAFSGFNNVISSTTEEGTSTIPIEVIEEATSTGTSTEISTTSENIN